MGKVQRWKMIGYAAALAAVGAAALFWLRFSAVKSVPPRMVLPGHTVLPGHDVGVRSLALLPNQKMLVSTGFDDAVRLWDVESGRLLETKRLAFVFDASASNDGRIIAFGGDRAELRLWDVSTGEIKTLRPAKAGSIHKPKFSPDDRTIVAVVDEGGMHSICIWDVETGALLHTLHGNELHGFEVAFSLDASMNAGTLAAVGSARTLKVWDLNTGALLHTIQHSAIINRACYSPDGKSLASASRDDTVKVWDVKTGALLHTLHGHRDWVLWVSYSPDGKRIVSAGRDKTIKIWDAAAGALLQTLKHGWEDLFAAVYLPNGKKLISFGAKGVRTWDAKTGERLQTFVYSSERVHYYAYPIDGKSLAGADNNGEILIWDIEEEPSAQQP